MLINVIESSSKGNSIVLKDNNSFLFLDFGTDILNIKNAFLKLNINSKSIVNALITHSHIDHVKSIKEKIICNINFYMSNETRNIIGNNSHNNFIIINNKSRWIKIPCTNWKFKSFPTIHNVEGSVAFIIKNKKNKIVYLTDTNYFENNIFKKATCYIVESNYGSEFIDSEKRNKIHCNSAARNHLNLEESEKFIIKYINKRTKLCIFSHLSSRLERTQLIQNVCNNLENKYKFCKFKFIDPRIINKIYFEF